MEEIAEEKGEQYVRRTSSEEKENGTRMRQRQYVVISDNKAQKYARYFDIYYRVIQIEKPNGHPLMGPTRSRLAANSPTRALFVSIRPFLFYFFLFLAKHSENRTNITTRFEWVAAFNDRFDFFSFFLIYPDLISSFMRFPSFLVALTS